MVSHNRNYLHSPPEDMSTEQAEVVLVVSAVLVAGVLNPFERQGLNILIRTWSLLHGLKNKNFDLNEFYNNPKFMAGALLKELGVPIDSDEGSMEGQWLRDNGFVEHDGGGYTIPLWAAQVLCMLEAAINGDKPTSPGVLKNLKELHVLG